MKPLFRLTCGVAPFNLPDGWSFHWRFRDPDAPIMVISRAEYRQRLRRAQELAGIADMGKSPLRLAGFFAPFLDTMQTLLAGSPQQSLQEVINGLTSQALTATRPAAVTVRELTDHFGKHALAPSFSCDAPEAHLQFPNGHRRHTARILCNLAKFVGEVRAEDMTTEMAGAFLKHEIATRTARSGMGLSRLSRMKIAQIAGSVFRFAIDRGLCHGNPFRGLAA